MRLFAPRARPCHETTGPALIARIARLQPPALVHRIRWRLMIDWWDLRRKPRRRGVPVA